MKLTEDIPTPDLPENLSALSIYFAMHIYINWLVA